MGEPTQAAAVGVIVYVALAIALLLFVSTWLITEVGFAEFWAPAAPTPFVAVHVNVVPSVVEDKFIWIELPLQIVSLLTNVAEAMGDGLMVMV